MQQCVAVYPCDQNTVVEMNGSVAQLQSIDLFTDITETNMAFTWEHVNIFTT